MTRILLTCALLCSLWGMAQAQDLGAAASGFVACNERHGSGCEVTYSSSGSVRETPALMEFVARINRSINAAIRYESDDVHFGRDYWTVPTDGSGDCEDYALAKKVALERAGVPSGALRLAFVFARHGSTVELNRDPEHVVLLLVTDRGTYILDSPIAVGNRGHADQLRTRDQAIDYAFYVIQNKDGRWESQQDLRITLR